MPEYPQPVFGYACQTIAYAGGYGRKQAAIFDEMKKAIDETLEELSDYRVAFAVEDTADERTEEK